MGEGLGVLVADVLTLFGLKVMNALPLTPGLVRSVTVSVAVVRVTRLKVNKLILGSTFISLTFAMHCK